MLPPRTVYSMVFRSHSSKQSTIIVSYSDVEGTISTKEIVVPAGGNATAPERHYERGSATYTMEITKIDIKGSNFGAAEPASIAAPFPGVHSPTKEYVVELINSNTGLTLVPKHSCEL